MMATTTARRSAVAAKPAAKRVVKTTAKTPAKTTAVKAVKTTKATTAKPAAKAPAKAKAAVPAQAVAPVVTEGGATFLEAVRIAHVEPSPDNPRTDLPNLDELARSIKEQGILEPLIVAPAEKGADPYNPRTRFTLISGHRRLAAAQLARLKTVPVLVRPDLVGAKADEARLVENLQRTDLSPIEEALAYERLVRVHGYKQVDIAAAVGRNQGHVSKTLLLLKLPPEAQAMIESGQLGKNDGVELARLPANAVPRALAELQRGEDAQVAVRNAASWAERENERQGAIKSLQKSGVKVTLANGPVKYDAHTGPLPLHYMGWVNPKTHAKLDCHAAIVGPAPRYTDDEAAGPVARWATLVCTTPSNHPHDEELDPEEAAKAAAAEAARRERQERKGALEAATTARREFIMRLVHGRARMAKTAAFEHLARVATLETLVMPLYGPTDDAFTLAGEWLGVKADDLRGELIARAVDGKGDQLVRTALALRLAVDELAMVDDSAERFANVHGPLVQEHLHFLQTLGYHASAAETEWVQAYADVDGYLNED